MQEIKHIFEPTPLQCGQAVLAMLCNKSVEEIISVVKTEKETTLKQMFLALDYYNISYDKTKKEAKDKTDLPSICILSLDTPRCWHWSLYYNGKFLDPEHGVLDDFPKCDRKYFWQINKV